MAHFWLSFFLFCRFAWEFCIEKWQGFLVILFLVSVPRGPCDRKKSIPIENFNPGSKFSIPIEIFNLNRKFQSPSFYLRGPRSVQRRARSKISIHDRSLEIFNPKGRNRIFSIPRPSGFPAKRSMDSSENSEQNSGQNPGQKKNPGNFRSATFL